MHIRAVLLVAVLVFPCMASAQSSAPLLQRVEARRQARIQSSPVAVYSTKYQAPVRSLRRTVSSSSAVFIRALRGDILRIRDHTGSEQEVRILGITAPDIINPAFDVECFGEDSRRYLASVLAGKSIDLRREEGYHYDSYGRLVRYVYSGGRDIGSWMLRNGYAMVDSDHEYSHFERYRQAELDARKDKLGLWSGRCEYQKTEDYRL